MLQVIETLPMQSRHDPEMKVRWSFREVLWYVPECRSSLEGIFWPRSRTSCYAISCERAKIKLDYERTCFTLQSELSLFGGVMTRRKVDKEVERTCDTPLTFDL